MTHQIHLIFLLTAFISVPVANPAAHAQQAVAADLASRIDEIVSMEEFENSFWGVMVVDLESGETLYQRNAQKSFVPASNVKLYTTSAALDLLGPHYRYHTRMYVDGPVENGSLKGNVIVKGAADPTIGGHYDAATGKWEAEIDALRLFRDWADSLGTAGIRRIEGDVVGDDDVVDDVPLGRGWSWDDETYYYAAQLSGLSFNDNVVHVHVEGQTLDEPARVWWDPANTDYVTVINQSRTISPDSSMDSEYLRRRGTNKIEVSTLVPIGREDIEEITVENPTLFFVHALRETLMRAGIEVDGKAVDVDSLSIKPDYASPDVRRVAVHVSRPLSDIVRMVNKPSQNLYADMLIKTLAAELPHPPTDDDDDDELEPGSAGLGLDIAMSTFVKAGVDTSRIQLADGSGLSRHNLVTPAMTAALLRFMWMHPDSDVRSTFFQSLPVAGVEGTLQYRMRSGPAFRNLRAKTGTLSNVTSLSGYVRAADGAPLAFVLMCNHFTTPTRYVRRAQDRIARVLAGFQD